MITAKQTYMGPGKLWWVVYIDGVMLRGKNGVGRHFKSKEAAEKAASK